MTKSHQDRFARALYRGIAHMSVTLDGIPLPELPTDELLAMHDSSSQPPRNQREKRAVAAAVKRARKRGAR